MATTALWRVTAHALSDLAAYVMNPEKTAINGKSSDEDPLENVMHYAARSDKVEDSCGEKRVYVSGVNCVPEIAVQQMNSVKEHFGKIGGVMAYHGYQSFAGWETSPEIAHEIGVRLAEELWGERYQVLVTTHLDRDSHLHNHFVINTVSFVDGIKYHRTKRDYYQMRDLSDRLCREYGLSVLEKSKTTKLSKRARDAKEAIDEAIARASSLKEFEYILKGMGFSVDLDANHSNWTIMAAGWERPIRMGSRLGIDYTNERIVERIANETVENVQTISESRHKVKVQVRGNFKKHRKAVGLRGLYYHYCYLLGIFPKKGLQSYNKYRYVLRDDLDRLNKISAETKLLATHHIDTAEQLLLYRESLIGRIVHLTDAHRLIYNKLRTVAIRNSDAETERLKAEMKALGEQVNEIRREVKLCDDIAKRSSVVKKRVRAIRSVKVDSAVNSRKEEKAAAHEKQQKK